MHLMSGNLSHQIEHHLFPDLPSNRYAEVVPKVQEICKRYGLPYTTGPLLPQVGSTWAKVFKLGLLDQEGQAKPGPISELNFQGFTGGFDLG